MSDQQGNQAKKPTNTIFDYMATPWTPYQASHVLRDMMKQGDDMDGVREMFIEHSGLSDKEIDAILGTLESEKADREAEVEEEG